MKLLESPRIRVLLAAVLAAWAAFPGAVAQTPSTQNPTIKVDVNLVTFSATLFDQSGLYRGPLRREDLSLSEDGVPQSISVFHKETVPVSVGVLIDTSGSMLEKLPQAVNALEHFVRTIQPDDDVFLMSFASSVELEQDFTGNRPLFSQAAHRMQARGSTRLYDALAEALDKVNQGRHRKKALVLITDGRDTFSYIHFNEILETARQSEILVYSIGIGNRGDVTPGQISRGGDVDDPVDMAVLNAIGDATGGRAFYLENTRSGNLDQLDRTAQEISTELREQYTVGYYSTNGRHDGTFRTIRLTSKLPGVQVRHRRGYYSPSETSATR